MAPVHALAPRLREGDDGFAVIDDEESENSEDAAEPSSSNANRSSGEQMNQVSLQFKTNYNII